MKFQLPTGSRNVILLVFIQDSSVSTGAGLAGLTQASSITGGYVKRDGLGVALTVDEDVATEGDYQAPSTAGQVRIGTPANMPAGFYELHFHDDLFSGADWITLGFAGATNMATLALEIQFDQAIIEFVVDNTGFAPTTTEFEVSSITEATASHFIGRVIAFPSDTLFGQATVITDYTLSGGGRGHFTVEALTDAPANNQRGRIY